MFVRRLGLALLSVGILDGCAGRVEANEADAGTTIDSGVTETSTPLPPDPEDSSVPLPPPDASPPDSGTIVDGEPPSDATPPIPGCKGTKHLFCDDFDAVSKETDGWDGLGRSDTGIISLSTKQSYSPKQSLLVGLTGVGFAALDKAFTFTSSSSVARAELQLFIADATFAGEASVLMLRDKAGTYSIAFGLAEGNHWWEETRMGGGGSAGSSSATLPLGTWIHVRLDVTLTGGGLGDYSLYVADMGTPLVSSTGLIGTGSPYTIVLTVGMQSKKFSGTASVFVDDVTFDLLP